MDSGTLYFQPPPGPNHPYEGKSQVPLTQSHQTRYSVVFPLSNMANSSSSFDPSDCPGLTQVDSNAARLALASAHSATLAVLLKTAKDMHQRVQVNRKHYFLKKSVLSCNIFSDFAPGLRPHLSRVVLYLGLRGCNSPSPHSNDDSGKNRALGDDADWDLIRSHPVSPTDLVPCDSAKVK